MHRNIHVTFIQTVQAREEPHAGLLYKRENNELKGSRSKSCSGRQGPGHAGLGISSLINGVHRLEIVATKSHSPSKLHFLHCVNRG